MPDLSTDDVVEVRIRQKLNGQEVINVLHYANTSGGVVDFATWVTAFHAQLKSGLIGLLTGMNVVQSEDLLIYAVDYQIIKPVRSIYVRMLEAMNGDIAVAALPPATAAQIVKQGSIAGKGRTGHFALAGLPIDSAVKGELTGAALTSVQVEVADRLKVVSVAEGITTTPIITTGKIGVEYNKVLNARAVSEFRTQKRRVVRRGI